MTEPHRVRVLSSKAKRHMVECHPDVLGASTDPVETSQEVGDGRPG